MGLMQSVCFYECRFAPKKEKRLILVWRGKNDQVLSARILYKCDHPVKRIEAPLPKTERTKKSGTVWGLKK